MALPSLLQQSTHLVDVQSSLTTCDGHHTVEKASIFDKDLQVVNTPQDHLAIVGQAPARGAPELNAVEGETGEARVSMPFNSRLPGQLVDLSGEERGDALSA